jgi:hypothetical protein
VSPSIAPLLKTPAKLVLRDVASEDALGDPVTTTSVVDVMAELQQMGATEALEGGLQTTRWRVFLPPDAPLDGWDAIEVEGRTYELDGDPNPIRSVLDDALHHVEAEAVLTR